MLPNMPFSFEWLGCFISLPLSVGKLPSRPAVLGPVFESTDGAADAIDASLLLRLNCRSGSRRGAIDGRSCSLHVRESDKREIDPPPVSEPRDVTGPPVNDARDTGPPVNDARDTGGLTNDARDTGGPANDARDMGGPANDARDAGPAVSDARDTGPPVSDARDTGPPVSDARDTGGPATDGRDIGGPMSDARDTGPFVSETARSDPAPPPGATDARETGAPSIDGRTAKLARSPNCCDDDGLPRICSCTIDISRFSSLRRSFSSASFGPSFAFDASVTSATTSCCITRQPRPRTTWSSL